jgi:acyl-CoA reductase-like NAD-dependent aldehyde dehydrogenase
MTRLHEATLASLHEAAERFGTLDGVARAALARRTALAVAAAADRWIDAAVAIKAAGGAAGPEVRAEETATGPLATLRLLVITAGCLREATAHGTPLPAATPRLVHRAGGMGRGGDAAELVAVDVLPKPRLADLAMFAGHSATVRCAVAGGLDSFHRVWRQEWRERPHRGGVAAILGAGNVTGLAVADAVSQIFEHGRAAALKLHPLHEPLLPVFQAALAPLIDAGMLAIAAGGADDAAALIGSPAVGHVHLTGGRAAFDAIVWGPGGPRPDGRPVLAKPVTCELGGVTPWIVVPGRYSDAQLGRQADFVAASILNNTSFNCIATKCLVTCRGWEQRSAFLDMVTRRLAAAPRRRAWYPGAAQAWEQVTESRPPADGTLPAVLRPGIDPVREPRWLEREWFVPVAVEVPLDADDIEAFCTRAAAFTRGLPGNLACSVTIPPALAAHDEQRVQLLVDHLEYGAVAVNTWVALAYAFASVPWGGFPGGTLAEPGSGIGFVHDPLCLPLVHNSIVRGPLCAAQTPPWLPWHRHGAALTRGAVDVYASLARGRGGLWPLVRMLPQVLAG